MQHLVGGISSAGRSLPPLDGRGLLIESAAGSWIWDQDGRRFIDMALGFGAILLGHANSIVNAAVVDAVSQGSMPAFSHPGEETAAAALTAPCGPLSMAMFTNSGSEAVHMACRISRAVTGRNTIAKIAGGFDGWFDQMAFGNAGAPETLIGNGPRPERHGTTLLRYNDHNDLERLFAENDDIAAVILEPMLANAGCILADLEWLAAVQETARRHGALVIADEVLMGFRIRFGLAVHGMGLDPDLATVGKAIGNGFAVAAVLGRPEFMAAAADGRAIRAGTYSGNPVATAAVTATLAQLATADYTELAYKGETVQTALVEAFGDRDEVVATTGFGPVFTLWFDAKAPTTYEAAAAIIRPERTLALHLALRREGIMTIPQPFGRFYLSFAHDAAVLEEMIVMIKRAVSSLPPSRN